MFSNNPHIESSSPILAHEKGEIYVADIPLDMCKFINLQRLEHYMRIKASRSSGMDSPIVQSNELEEEEEEEEEEINLILEATCGKNKKGRIYGLGSEARDIDITPYSHRTSLTINTVHQPDIESVVTELKENANLKQQNETIKKQNETILSRLEALEQKLSGHVNDSNIEANDGTS